MRRSYPNWFSETKTTGSWGVRGVAPDDSASSQDMGAVCAEGMSSARIRYSRDGDVDKGKW